MVDLVKIRKKKQKQKEEEAAAEAATSGTPASSPPPPAPPPAPRSGSEDAAGPAGGDAGAPLAPPTTDHRQPATASKLDRFKETAGKRRDVIAAQATDTGAVTLLELLTFVIAREQYAVEIERIVEIVTPRPLTRIPNADPSILGIISLRGTIVTLVDVRRKLRHPEAGEAGADTRIVVIDFHNEMVGFLVDRVLRVVKAAAADIEPHPVVHSNELVESIRGVFRPAGALTILLDLDKLLDHRALAATTA
jgi:purine-binding chemotaxis protein CheW